MVLEEENPFKVMQMAQLALLDEEVLPEWTDSEAKISMSYANAMKFRTCTHAMEALLNSTLHIVEATGDKFWGMGLHMDATRECLSEHWLGPITWA